MAAQRCLLSLTRGKMAFASSKPVPLLPLLVPFSYRFVTTVSTRWCQYPSPITTNTQTLFTITKRFKRGTKKRRSEEEAERGGAMEKGTEIDTEAIKEKMRKEMAKLQSSLLKVQPKGLNLEDVEKIKVEVGESRQKKSLNDLADLAMRGTVQINILVRDPSNNSAVLNGVSLADSSYNPYLDKTGMVVLPVPRPSEEQLNHLRKGVKIRCENAKDAVRNIHKKAINQTKTLKDHVPKDDLFIYTESLKKAVQEQCTLIDGIQTRKLAEFR